MIESPCASIVRGLEEIGQLSQYDKSYLDREILACKSIVNSLRQIETKLSCPFHGSESVESYLYLFREFGLDRFHPTLQKMINKLVETDVNDGFYESGIGRVGRILEEHGHSGADTIRAAALVHADSQLQVLCIPEIEHSITIFDSVSQYASIHDFAVQKNGKWIYRPGKLFPDFFNLKLLAFSDLWKSKWNIVKLGKAFDQLRLLEPLPQIYIYHKGQFAAPGCYLMRDFDVSYFDCDDDQKAAWLKRTEWVSRMGMLGQLPVVSDDVTKREHQIVQTQIRRRTHFTRWGSYSGLALEPDWKADQRRQNDIQYRITKIKYFVAHMA